MVYLVANDHCLVHRQGFGLPLPVLQLPVLQLPVLELLLVLELVLEPVPVLTRQCLSYKLKNLLAKIICLSFLHKLYTFFILLPGI
jgi:hypothetical protein